jgi:FKBP-type peptidyl-prolyl cis-trans isomerase SlyD
MKIARSLTVEIEYELRVKGGAVIESSAKTGPLKYVHGDGKMLPGLERRLEGLSPGDERRGSIPAAEAFGSEESLPLKEMTRADFPPSTKLDAGAVFEAKSVTGQPVQFKVISVEGSTIKTRLLHPLVGRDLEFRVKVLSVSDPRKPPPPPGAVELDADEIMET